MRRILLGTFLSITLFSAPPYARALHREDSVPPPAKNLALMDEQILHKLDARNSVVRRVFRDDIHQARYTVFYLISSRQDRPFLECWQYLHQKIQCRILVPGGFVWGKEGDFPTITRRGTSWRPMLVISWIGHDGFRYTITITPVSQYF